MIIQTLRTPFKKARLVNQTSASFVSKVPTATSPVITDASSATAGVGVELTQPNGGSAVNAVMIVPYGVGADDTTFSLRVIGWQKSIGLVGQQVADTELWIPVKLAEFLCTIGTAPGISGRYVDSTENLCDIIALVGTSGHDGVNCDIVSPADNTIAHVTVDLKGSSIVEISFSTGSSATSCNALLSYL